jgi:pimeloyl-ACP methyl ester carboxylesterase
MHEELITLRDGRVLEVASWGDPALPTVVFHHGTPGSSRTLEMLGPLVERGESYFVTTSRAGYGRSSRDPGRSFASVVADTRAALDHLERTTYTSMGVSGGGPHALACGALDAPRCRGVVSIAGVVPVDADIDWTEGMGPENIEEFAMAMEGGPAFEAAIEAASTFLAESTAENIVDLMGGLLSPPDLSALGEESVRALFASSTAYGFHGGWHGFYDDDVATFASWGFDPRDITVPVDLFYGDQDLMVPPAHGRWLSANLPTARTHHHLDEGHLSIFVNRIDEIAAALASSSAP